MDNLIFYNFDNAPRAGRITGRKIRIHNKPGNRTVTFSSDCRDELLAIDEPRLQVAENRLTGEMFLVINSKEGVRIKENNPGTKSSPIVYSKHVVDFLCKKLVLDGECVDVELSKNVSITPEAITYILLHKS